MVPSDKKDFNDEVNELLQQMKELNALEKKDKELKEKYSYSIESEDRAPSAKEYADAAMDLANLDRQYAEYKAKYYPQKADDVEGSIAEEERRMQEAEDQEEEFIHEKEGEENNIDAEGNFIGKPDDLIDLDGSQEDLDTVEETYHNVTGQKEGAKATGKKSFFEQFELWKNLESKWEQFKKKCQSDIAALIGPDRGKALRDEHTRERLKEPTFMLKLVNECMALCKKWIDRFADRLFLSQANTEKLSPEEGLAELEKKLKKAKGEQAEKMDQLLKSQKSTNQKASKRIERSLGQINNYIELLEKQIEINKEAISQIKKNR